MNLTNKILLILAVLLIASCSEPYEPETVQVTDETVVLAELEVGKDVSLSITSTYGPNGEATFPTSDEGDVLLSNPDNGQLNKELRWVGKLGRWIQTSFRFDEGDEIVLDTDFSGLGLGATKATCVVPPKGKLKSSEPTQMTMVEDTPTFELDFKLDEIPSDNYYHLVPQVLYRGISYPLNIKDVNDGAEASYHLSHTDGILIDYSALSGEKNIQLIVHSTDLSELNPSTIYLKVKTVPQAYYEYHISLSNQKETQQGPFEAPVPTYTNIEGGQGIFVAYQTALDSLIVQ